MTILVNNKFFTDEPKQPLENKPRLRWDEIASLAGIPKKQIHDKLKISYTLPDNPENRFTHVHGFSLILVDGMNIRVDL